MTAFSPVAAATEGLRVIRREPTALLGWIAIWVAALIVVTLVQMITIDHGVPGHTVTVHGGRGMRGVIDRFGPYWPILVTTLFILTLMTTTTLFRAVLLPNEHGWHLFKLGADEARLGLITVAATVLLVAFGSAPAVILWLIAKPFLAADPRSSSSVVILGTLLTAGVDIWIGVRLSLAPAHAFAERRFDVLGYWRLTRGNFWRLLLSYALIAMQIIVLFSVVFLILFMIGQAAGVLASGRLDLTGRIILFVMAGVAAVLLAILFVVPLTLVCAGQALAYAAIVKPDPASPWGASRRGAWPPRHPRMPGEKV